jgi:GT2 family glycosyltransferase
VSVVDVSVVIVNWNTRDDLRNCLRSVFDETKDVSLEVFVVDNASADGSAQMVRTEFPAVTLIANDTNRGFAAANNQALVRTTGRYALLLNPDTSVVDGAIGRTVRIADADPGIGVLGCQVLLREGEIQRTCFRFSSAFREFLVVTCLDRMIPASWLDGGPTMRNWDRTSARDVDVVSGMYMLVRREAMDEVGVMDDAYFVYAEEADWCFRFRKAGWRCVFTPDARIIHHDGGGKSTSQIRAKMHVQMQKSILIFHRKNLGLLSFAALKCVYATTNAVRVVLFGVQSLFAPVARPKARCAWAALVYQVCGLEPVR